MATRQITGTIRHAGSAAPWSGATVTARLLEQFALPGGVYPPDSAEAVTAADGTFALSLAVPDAGTAYYSISYPQGYFTAYIEAGASALTLEDLVTTVSAGAPATAALLAADTQLQANIDAEASTRSSADAAHAAAVDPHPQYLTQAEADALYSGAYASQADLTAEVNARTNADSAHVAAADPHAQYTTDADLSAHAGTAATAAAIGHVKPGAGLSVDVAGTLAAEVTQAELDAEAASRASADGTIASGTVLGHVKVGTGLAIDAGGVLSASGGTSSVAAVAKAYLAATVSNIAANTPYYPVLTEQYDYDNVLDPATATITIPSAGIYRIDAWAVTQQAVVSNSNTTVELWLLINGAGNIFASSDVSGTSRYVSTGGGRQYQFAAGDTLRMYTVCNQIYHLSGGGTNTYMGCQKIR